MESLRIADTARVHPGAQIGAGTEIGHFCIVDEDVVIGENCRIEPYVWIKRFTTLGSDNLISAHTVIGTDPLDKNFRGEPSYLRIGNRNTIREHYTISRGTEPHSVTEIGDGNYMMTSGHIAHNCKIGNDNVFASCALVAGHVEVGNRAFLSGGVVVHQRSKVGSYVMVGGNSRVNRDLPPYFLYSGFDAAATGLNLVGLRRAGFSAADISTLKAAYRILFRSGLRLEDALERIRTELPGSHAQHLVGFIGRCTRGIARE
jgi:UDP-N-acetylglucosamine acyltransferase